MKFFGTLKVAILALLFLAGIEAYAQAPTLHAPINNSICVPVATQLDWTPPANHFKSRVLIATDLTFNNIVLDVDSVETTYLDITLPGYATNYFWKIIAYKFEDTTTAHSVVWKFTTKQRPVNLLEPYDNDFCISNNPVLTWDTIPGAFHYRVEYSRNPNFIDSLTTAINFVVGRTVTLPNLLNNTRYYWRVRGNFPSCEGYWSVARTFRTKPARVNLVSPLNNAQGLPLFANGFPFNLTLKWNKVANAHHYVVQLSDSVHFRSIIINANTTDTTYAVADTLKNIPNKPYFWRVAAVVDNDSLTLCMLDYSSVNTFRTPFASVSQISPVNEQTCVPLNAQFVWRPILNTKSYNLQISSTAAFADTLYNVELIKDTTALVVLTQDFKDYFWRVRAKDSSNVGYWSGVNKFTSTLKSANAVFPLDSTVGLNNLVHFVWSESDTNNTYRLQVSEQSTFATLVLDTNNLRVSTFTFLLPNFNKVYYWRVKSSRGACESAWTKAFRMKTYVAPPVLETPLDSATNVEINPTFIWKPVVAAVTYEIQIDTTLTFNLPIGRIGIPTTEVKLTTPLNENTRYFWRVRAYNQEGIGPWSLVRTFKTAYILPDVPKLLSPSNATVKLPIDLVTLVWNKPSKAKRYHLQVTKEVEFANLVADTLVADTTFALRNLTNYTVYKFRVRAENEGGYSDWSNVFYFRTINVMPTEAATLVTPANDATMQPINIKLGWLEVANCEYYHLQIAKDNAFTQIVSEDKSLYVLFKNLYNLDYETKYYWRVKGANETGEGPWSEVRNFTTTPFVSVEEANQLKYSVNVFPNPANSHFAVEFTNGSEAFVMFEMYDILGSKVYAENGLFHSGTNAIHLNAEEFSQGIYTWNLRIGSDVLSGKIVVTK